MKYTKSITMLVLAIFIFTAASVCASDVNNTIVANEDNTVLELPQTDADEIASAKENEMTGQEENVELISEGNVGTFTELQENISHATANSTLKLDKNYEYDDDFNIEGILIDKVLTIDGQGHKIDAKGQARIFNVTAENITLKNIIFTNGNATASSSLGSGGAIYQWWYCESTVTNCTFTNNYAHKGGAVYSYGSITMRDCTFTNNKAERSGGAVYSENGGSTATNCNFINNTAYDYGAVRLDYGEVTNCEFTNNKVYSDTGAVYIQYGNVTNCKFTNNKAPQFGAIFMNSGNVTNCIFVNNSAEYIWGVIFFQRTTNTCPATVNNNIFLNNQATPVVFMQETPVANCNYNWEGSDTTDYAPQYPNTDTFLFLNTTANPDTIYISDTSNITFKLYMYNSTSKKVFEYDNDLLYPVDLTVTATNGNINKNTVKLGETITFTPTTWGTGSVTASIGNAAYTVKLNIIKVDSTLTVDDMTFDYNSTGSTTVSFTNATGVVANVIDHPEANVTVNGNTITVSNIAAGNYTLNVTTIVNETYNPVTKTAKITVNKLATAIALTNETLDLKVNDMDTISVNLTPAGAGNLTYVSSNESVVQVVDGLYLACGKGTAIISVSFTGNENYTAAENRTIKVTVTLRDASVSVKNATLDLKVGERFDLNAASDPHYLNIEYVSSNPSVVSVTDYGIITAEGEGTAVITLTVGNNETYALNSTNVTVTVSRITTEITSSAITTVYNINKELTVTLKDINGTPIRGAKLTVDLNGAKTYTTDKNGQVKVSTKGLAPKAYTAKITFNGDTNYAESSKDAKVTVKKATPKLTAKKKTFKSSVKTKKYTVTLKDNTGKAIKKAKVTLKVKGKTYKATTNSKGKATFKIKKLNKKGTFKATVTYKGNKYYNKATKKAKIKVIVTFKTVSKGSKDKATVKEIQQALKNNGYYLTYDGHYLKIDGIYHGCTERSVKEFQHDKGLKVTGKVDEKTAKKLGII